MKKSSLTVAGVTVGLLMLLAQGSAVHAAEIKVLSANAMRGVITELGPQFERKAGHKLAIQYDVVGPLKRKIDAGESFDVVILTTPLVNDLAKAGKVAAGTSANIARTGLGVVVRAGAPKPGIGSSDAFKRALLNAKSITYNPEGASGAQFIKILARLGITDRGRDTGYPVPPAQIPAGAIRAPGSHLGWVTAKRTSGQG